MSPVWPSSAIVVIVAGIFTISWWGNFINLIRDPLDFLRDPGTRYATLTGLTIAGYAIVDKRGVSHVEPVLYMYLLTLGSALGLFSLRASEMGYGPDQHRMADQFRYHYSHLTPRIRGIRIGPYSILLVQGQLRGSSPGGWNCAWGALGDLPT